MAERKTFNRMVGVQVPPKTLMILWRNWIARLTSNQKVVGSIPRMGSLLLFYNILYINYLKHANPFLQYHLLIPENSQNKCIRT